MSTITFDTLEYVKTLRAAGVPEVQAEAMAKVQRDSLANALDTQLATKADIAEVKADITDLKAEMRLLKWMLALVIIVTVVPALKAFFG